jgi:hypothetical protein
MFSTGLSVQILCSLTRLIERFDSQFGSSQQQRKAKKAEQNAASLISMASRAYFL